MNICYNLVETVQYDGQDPESHVIAFKDKLAALNAMESLLDEHLWDTREELVKHGHLTYDERDNKYTVLGSDNNFRASLQVVFNRIADTTPFDKPKKRKYEVHYSFYLSDSIEVEATSEAEAKAEVERMLNCCEIGNLNEMDVGERNVWVD